MRYRPIFLSIAATLLAAPAMAQTPDRMCVGLDGMVKAASAQGGLAGLASGWKDKQISADVAPPVGMEGVYNCSVVRASTAGGKDELDCIWMFPANNVPDADSASVAARVKACLLPAGWKADALIEDRGAQVQRFSRAGSAAEVVIIEAQGARNARTARLSISALAK